MKKLGDNAMRAVVDSVISFPLNVITAYISIARNTTIT